ncbi:Aspartyl-tRNA(Asn) amidotransferase subunit A amidotransferase subunit A [Actinomycetales bacterium JB111]|nr:Aspartyl-tRNA(Asn) amidotransferase subunit A amidotransferase subunit A [Actinomycetales bacterium JB111]
MGASVVHLDHMGVAEMARLVAQREISPAALMAAHLDKIAALDESINAVVSVNPLAMEAARRAESEVLAGGSDLGRLHGVPFTVKDTFDVRGMPATRGSLLFRDRIARSTATSVQRLLDEGAILLGKTNTAEFALWWETENRVFGRTNNPFDLNRTSGGSSGGDAAAVASGMSPLGIASDLSGSIRIPAHYCGVWGLKPTHGLVPLTGHWPAVLAEYTHVGPIARCVEDIGVALDVMAGPDDSDWYAVAQAKDLKDVRRSDVASARIGFLPPDAFGPTSRDVRSAMISARKAIHGTVGSVDELEVPPALRQDFDLLTRQTIGVETNQYYMSVVDGRREDLHHSLQKRLVRPEVSLGEYEDARARIREARIAVHEMLAHYEAVVCVVAPVVAPLHNEPRLNVDGLGYGSRSVMSATIPFALAGVPALSVPVSMSPGGLPVGLQVVGPRLSDRFLLVLGEQLRSRMLQISTESQQ